MRISTLIATGYMCLASATVNAQGSTTPSITKVLLASGSFNTSERTVRLDITAQGSPSAYRASENKEFTGAAWKVFTTAPSFTLSSGYGGKIVYVQVGKSPTINTDISRTTTPTLTRSIEFVPTPTVVSNIVADTVIYGLPDLQSEVTMPSTVKPGSTFNFVVTIKNEGQSTPPGTVIHVYNSFVTNYLAIEHVEVNWMMQNLVGDGCWSPDVPTMECTLAPMPKGHVVAIELRGRVLGSGGLTGTITQATHKLRTRIVPIQESNTANNWRDTPITIVK